MKKMFLGVVMIGLISFVPAAFGDEGGGCGVSVTDDGANVTVTVNLCESILVPWTNKNGEIEKGAYLGVRGAQRVRIQAAQVNLDQASVEYTYLTSPSTQVKFERGSGRTYVANFNPSDWDRQGGGAAVGNWQIRLEDGKTVVFFNLAAFQVNRNGQPCDCLVSKPNEPETLAFSFKKKS